MNQITLPLDLEVIIPEDAGTSCDFDIRFRTFFGKYCHIMRLRHPIPHDEPDRQQHHAISTPLFARHDRQTATSCDFDMRFRHPIPSKCHELNNDHDFSCYFHLISTFIKNNFQFSVICCYNYNHKVHGTLLCFSHYF